MTYKPLALRSLSVRLRVTRALANSRRLFNSTSSYKLNVFEKTPVKVNMVLFKKRLTLGLKKV
jgi:hypothetical protein